MTISISLADWTTHQESALIVRRQVFVAEHHIPEAMVSDEMDSLSLHAVAVDGNGRVLGAGRLLPNGRIGRMAVLAAARGMGVGGHILQRLMQAAADRGDQGLGLSATVQAQGFYARYGFSTVGEQYTQAGIAHIEMEYQINPAA